MWGNPITKECTCYVLTDKWILAQKLWIPKIQFTDYMKLKNMQDQCVDASVCLRSGGYSKKTKCWAQTEEKTTKGLPHLGSIPYTIPKPGCYCRCREVQANRNLIWLSPEKLCYSQKIQIQIQPTIGLSTGSLIEELEKGLKELRTFTVPWGEQECQLARQPGTGPPAK